RIKPAPKPRRQRRHFFATTSAVLGLSFARSDALRGLMKAIRKAVRKQTNVAPGPCNPACTKVIQFMTLRQVSANQGISIPPYTKIDGYRFINIFVQFTQETANEPSVDLGVVFAFDANGNMGARSYVNLDANVASSQSTNFINVTGVGV